MFGATGLVVIKITRVTATGSGTSSCSGASIACIESDGTAGEPRFTSSILFLLRDRHIGNLEYANLLYACATCNTAKRGILGVPDPCSVAFADCVRIGEDGQIEALNQAGESLVKKLRLNSVKNVQHRNRWMRVLAALQLHEPDLYCEYMAFPDELPDLRTKRAPQNSRAESVVNCWFALRERGELPAIY